MKPLLIKETCLYHRDLKLAENFYSQTLGFDLYGKVAGRHVFYRLKDGQMLLLFNPEATALDQRLPYHYASGRQHIAFEVEDYESWKKRLSGLGIVILAEQIWTTGKKSFYFHDPAGHVLEIAEQGIWP